MRRRILNGEYGQRALKKALKKGAQKQGHDVYYVCFSNFRNVNNKLKLLST